MRAGGSIAEVRDALPGVGEVVEVLTLRAGYNTNMVLIGTALFGVAAGVIGVFALLRKRSLTTDALSHATLPGIGLAFLAAGALGMEGRSLPVLLGGAAATGVLGVVCIQGILRHTRLREDAAIGIVLSVFFGAGVIVLSYIQANAASGAAGLNKFIYGQTAAMGARDAQLMGAIALVAVVVGGLLLKEFAIVCFNDSYARVQGWSVGLIDLLMMGLVVVVTVAGLQAVGLILVVAMLIIPAASARFWSDRLWVLVVLAGVIGAASGYLGSSVSALLPRKPAGAVIVLTSGAMFAVSMLLAPRRGVIAAGVRGLRMRVRIACEHVLEEAYERGTAGGGYAVDGAELAGVTRVGPWSRVLGPMVRWRLGANGYVRRAGAGIELTTEGVARGARVRRNHKLWEEYLVSYAEIAPSHVDWSVDQVEHVLSDALIRELEAQLAERGIVVADGEGA